MTKLRKFKKLRMKSFILFVLGILIGLIISSDVRKCAGMSLIYTLTSGKFPKDMFEVFQQETKTKNNIHTELMLVGILTAKKYVNTRMMAANNTWTKTISGKVLFFSGEDSSSKDNGDHLLIALPGVDDAYPPQKKSFLNVTIYA